MHDPDYVRSFLDGSIPAKKIRMIGLPWSETLVKRTLIGTGSAIAAALTALEHGVACTCNGGTHHAHRDYGTGVHRLPFLCVFYISSSLLLCFVFDVAVLLFVGCLSFVKVVLHVCS